MPDNIVKTDEISLRDVLIKIGGLRHILLSRWKIILSVSIISGGLGLTSSMLLPDKFAAVTTFLSQEIPSSSAFSPLMQMASQFAIGGFGVKTKEEQLVELLKSRKVVTDALLKEASVNKRKAPLAVHALRTFGMEESLLKGLGTANAARSVMHDSILYEIYKEIVLSRLSVDLSSRSGIITVTFTSPDEMFSKSFASTLIMSLNDYYQKSMTEKQRKVFDILSYKADSIVTALRLAEIQLARVKDSNSRIIKAEGYLEEARLTRDVNILNLMFAEAVKNKEMAGTALLNETPVLQIIDIPSLPLENTKVEQHIGLLIGLMTGLLFSVLYIFINALIKLTHDS